MRHLKEQLISQQATLAAHTATLGFDGFIDTIVTPVKNNSSADYFTSLEEWGQYILSKKGSNFSIELIQRSTKAGGNMPNMATALSKLGIPVHCVGTLGYPSIDPIFRQLPAQCQLYSFAAAGTCQAIEFNDGKMMLAGMSELNKADWQLLKQRVPISTLISLFDTASLVGLLNWGELTASTGFWKGLLQEVLPFCKTGKEKIFFVDLSDCSSRSRKEILAALDLLTDFSRYGKLVLSLNKNECRIIYNNLFETAAEKTSLKEMGQKIFTRLLPSALIIHHREHAMAFSKNEFVLKNSFVVSTPLLLTGAGDNFNAGFCFAQLMGCALEDSLTIAHLAAACYIKNGESADWSTLLEALENV